jgi:5-methylcytosine-specific restriction endonuclease McrA
MIGWNCHKNNYMTAKKISDTLKRKGIKPPSNLGKHFTSVHVNKIIESKRKNGSLYHTKERTDKIQSARKIYYDTIGRSSKIRDLIEGTIQYKNWHKLILFRDKFRCIQCGSKINIQVHHKIPLDHFIRVGNFDIAWILSFSNLFDINNGETLCKKCHSKTDSYARSNYFGLGESLKLTGEGYLELTNIYTGKIIRETFTNMVVTAGKNSIADGLRGNEVSNKGIITYCAVGTGTTAPALADTDLETELFRKLISVRSAAANVATFQTFYTTGEANGTLKEAGLFGDDADGTADSGTLFCRVAINRTKSSSDTLSLNWSVTVG